MFASAKRLDGGNGWRWRLEQIRKRLFGKKSAYHSEVLPMAYRDDDRDSLGISTHSSVPVRPNRDMKLKKRGDGEDKSTQSPTTDDLDRFIGNYEYSTRSRSSRVSSTLSGGDDRYSIHNARRIERDSLYSEATGNQRLTPEPRQPLKRDAFGGSKLVTTPVLIDLGKQEDKVVGASLPLQTVHSGVATEAQVYAMSVRPGLITVSANSQPPAMASTFTRTTALTPTRPLIGQNVVVNTHPIGGPQQEYQLVDDPLDRVVLEPMNTGGSSRNPFRQGAF
jgi:hypothetical protein